MHDHVRSVTRERRVEAVAVEYVSHHKWPPSHRIAMTRRKIVVGDRLMTPLSQGLACMAADKAGAPGHKNFHCPHSAIALGQSRPRGPKDLRDAPNPHAREGATAAPKHPTCLK